MQGVQEDSVARLSVVRFSLALSLTVGGVVSLACSSTSGSSGGSTSAAPTFTQIYSDVIVGAKCVQCHAPADSGAVRHDKLDMSTKEAAYANLVGVATSGPGTGCKDGLIRVTPGDPSTSVMYEKISEDKPPCGVRMPYGCNDTPADPSLPCVSTALQEEVAAWITAGAKSD
jgi:hypothetical protein